MEGGKLVFLIPETGFLTKLIVPQDRVERNPVSEARVGRKETGFLAPLMVSQRGL